MIYKKNNTCRICGSNNLVSILNLGTQALTGIFPNKGTNVESGPLELEKCSECHLVQMAHSYDLSLLYGDNYGYRSGLNQSMVDHLKSKVQRICNLVSIEKNDLIVDIGSNDGTTLGHYEDRSCQFVGIDPSGLKFKKYYKADIQLIPNFFTDQLIKERFGDKKAKVITSFAMFYDLEKPIQFAKEIANSLHHDGVWVFEQSYLPLMIDTMAYDTVCHEHLEYYGLYQIQYILKAAKLKMVDVELNDINGGSFSVTAAHEDSSFKTNSYVQELLDKEKSQGYQGLDLFEKYDKNVKTHRSNLINLVKELRAANKTIHAYGASTKGNVILQYCNFTSNEIQAVAEVNEDKFGKETPGTKIPIVSETDSKRMSPDYYLVLPWHFKKNILKREAAYIDRGGKFIFPMPEIHVVTKENLSSHI